MKKSLIIVFLLSLSLSIQSQNDLGKSDDAARIVLNTFVPDDEDRVRGCYTSHLSVMRKIIKEYANKKDFRILIIEDNLESTNNIKLSQVINGVNSFFNTRNNFASKHINHYMH